MIDRKWLNSGLNIQLLKVFLTADVGRKTKLSCPSSAASYAISFTSNLHGVCGMVWYRTSSYAISFTSNLHGVCGMVWYRTSSYAISFTSNLHGVCGMVWYRTSSYAHRSPQTYMTCVAWFGIGHQAMHIVHLKPTWRVWHGVV